MIRWRVVALAMTAVLVVALVGATVAMWPRDDVPQDPDAVVVLGGGGDERAARGIELSRRYDVPLVLSTTAAEDAAELGVFCGQDATCIDPVPVSTRGEAITTAELADAEGWDHVTVVTTEFHTTRSRVLFRQCLGDGVSVVGALPPDGDRQLDAYPREALGIVAALTIQRAC